MIRILGLSLFLFASLWEPTHAQEAPPAADADPVLAIYTKDDGLASTGELEGIVGIWANGSVVWSGDSLRGGAPYFKAKLTSDDVKNLMLRFEKLGLFEVAGLEHVRFGPDSSYTTIAIKHGEKSLKMSSWHELFEADSRLIAASTGVTSLEGKPLLPELAKEPAEYLHYRLVWLQIRFAVAELIPKQGVPATSGPDMEAGRFFWNEPLGKDVIPVREN